MDGKGALKAGLLIFLLLAGAWLLLTRMNAGQEAVPAVKIPATRAQAAEKRVRLVADEWCPVSCDESEGEPAGYAVDIARNAFAAAGYQTVYSVQPWARAVSETRKGGADGIVGTLVDNTPDFVFPQETIGNNVNVFFTLASNTWKYKGIASLDGIVVGAANEYVFGNPLVDDYLRNYAADPHRVQLLFTQDPVMQGIGLLKAERIGTYLDDRMVMNWNLKQHKMDIALREAGDVSNIPLFIAFSPANPRSRELAAVFDNGVNELRRSGQLSVLLANYGMKDWAEKPAQK